MRMMLQLQDDPYNSVELWSAAGVQRSSQLSYKESVELSHTHKLPRLQCACCIAIAVVFGLQLQVTVVQRPSI